jgi:hypothetical protein
VILFMRGALETPYVVSYNISRVLRRWPSEWPREGSWAKINLAYTLVM